MLAESDVLPVTFVAMNLQKVPTMTPGEQERPDITSVADRVATLERQMATVNAAQEVREMTYAVKEVRSLTSSTLPQSPTLHVVARQRIDHVPSTGSEEECDDVIAAKRNVTTS